MQNLLNTLKARRQRGFGMIETIMVLALAAGFIVGGLVLFGNAQLSNNTTDASRAMVQISSETRAANRTATDYSGASIQDLIDSQAIANNLVVGVAPTQQIVLPYNGVVTLPAPAAGAQQFALTVTWPEGSKASAICARLSVTPPAGGVGPLGTDYTVTSTCATTGTAPTLTATYNR